MFNADNDVKLLWIVVADFNDDQFFATHVVCHSTAAFDDHVPVVCKSMAYEDRGRGECYSLIIIIYTITLYIHYLCWKA